MWPEILIVVTTYKRQEEIRTSQMEKQLEFIFLFVWLVVASFNVQFQVFLKQNENLYKITRIEIMKKCLSGNVIYLHLSLDATLLFRVMLCN